MAKPKVILRRAPEYDPVAIEISMEGNHLIQHGGHSQPAVQA
jgi:hypothetical protein